MGMTRVHKVMVVMVVVVVGVWGCSQGDSKSANARNLDKIKALEAKCGTLEQECQAALSSRDQIQKRLSAIEQERSRLTKLLEVHKIVCQERDDMKALAASRTS